MRMTRIAKILDMAIPENSIVKMKQAEKVEKKTTKNWPFRGLTTVWPKDTGDN